jgi:hypothetical protein
MESGDSMSRNPLRFFRATASSWAPSPACATRSNDRCQAGRCEGGRTAHKAVAKSSAPQAHEGDDPCREKIALERPTPPRR